MILLGSAGEGARQFKAAIFLRSEEDNDATDDGSAVSVPRSHAHAIQKSAQARRAAAGRTALAAAVAASDTDTGVDSPTYDGDVESSVTITSQVAQLGGHERDEEGTTTSPGSALSSLPSSAFHGDHSIVGHGSDSQATPPRIPIPLPPTAIEITMVEPTPTEEVANTLDPASLTPIDIRTFVSDAIAQSRRLNGVANIPDPPTDRPVRVYADGTV